LASGVRICELRIELSWIALTDGFGHLREKAGTKAGDFNPDAFSSSFFPVSYVEAAYQWETALSLIGMVLFRQRQSPSRKGWD
jgi:hypothetical protein